MVQVESSRPVVGGGGEQGAAYERGLHARPQVWRCVLAILAGLSAVGGALGLTVPLGAVVDAGLGLPVTGFQDFRLTPGTWLAGAALIALMIPVASALQRAIYGVPVRWLSSVEGRFRWRWAGTAAIVVVPAFGLVSALFIATEPGRGWQWSMLPLAVVAVVLTPLQAAGEEWLFRGLFGRAFSAPFTRSTAALIASLSGSTLLSSLPSPGAHCSSGWDTVRRRRSRSRTTSPLERGSG